LERADGDASNGGGIIGIGELLTEIWTRVSTVEKYGGKKRGKWEWHKSEWQWLGGSGCGGCWAPLERGDGDASNGVKIIIIRAVLIEIEIRV
jgi:hypothetical protein